MKINLNHIIKVKLTDLGNKIYEDYLRNEYKFLSHYPSVRWIDLKHRKDQDGYIRFQLWEFMSIFGEHFYVGSEAVPEDNEIIFPDDTVTIELQEQLRKARKKAKRWKRKYLELRYKLDKDESEEEGIRQVIKDATVIERSLCDSCINNGCIFQSGIVRSHCDFYKAESEE